MSLIIYNIIQCLINSRNLGDSKNAHQSVEVCFKELLFQINVYRVKGNVFNCPNL